MERVPGKIAEGRTEKKNLSQIIVCLGLDVSDFHPIKIKVHTFKTFHRNRCIFRYLFDSIEYKYNTCINGLRTFFFFFRVPFPKETHSETFISFCRNRYSKKKLTTQLYLTLWFFCSNIIVRTVFRLFNYFVFVWKYKVYLIDSKSCTFHSIYVGLAIKRLIV